MTSRSETMSAGGSTRPVLVLEGRQLTAAGLVAVLLIGIIACLGYVTGRSVTAVLLSGAARSGCPTLTIVDPAPARPPAAAPFTAIAAPAPQAPQPKTPAAGRNSATPLIEPSKGQVYLQVGAVDRGVAAVMAEGLVVRGLPGKYAAGPDAKTWRVLVGPLASPDLVRTERDLKELGFTVFPRVY